jgi:hypothetical protein
MKTLKPGKQNAASRAETLSAGTTKHFTNASQELAFGGATYPVTQVKANLQEIADLRTATTEAQASAKAKVAAERAQLPQLLLFMAAYLAFVKATFGSAPDVLADFGLTPRKVPTPLTPEQKAAAKAKRTATREARGTRGSVQKKKVVGNVIGVVLTPVTAPQPSSSPPATATPNAPATGAVATPPAPGAVATPGSGTTTHAS